MYGVVSLSDIRVSTSYGYRSIADLNGGVDSIIQDVNIRYMPFGFVNDKRGEDCEEFLAGLLR